MELPFAPITEPVDLFDDPHLNLEGQTVLFEYLVNHEVLK